MRRIGALLICVLLLFSLFAGCAGKKGTPSTTTAPTQPAGPVELSLEEKLAHIATLGSSPDDNYRVWYEMFVYAFCDSNGDGIGDFKGATSKLDYLQQLGINGIWLMPIHASTSYHKYNVTDYYTVDPKYGTMEDFDEFLSECNKRGIKVILDLVVNHTGNRHNWFLTARKYLQSLNGKEPDPAECQYVDYYNFVLTKNAPSTGYAKIPNSDYSYECKFSNDMPDLKLENPTVRKEVEDIMKFWMDKGVGGFRVDAAKEFYSGNTPKNVEVLSWLQQAATAIKPDAYMVAEVWDSFNTIAQYYKSGFTSIFNYRYGASTGSLASTVRGAGRENVVNRYARELEQTHKAYVASNPNYIDAPFGSNHDVGRLAGFATRDEEKVKLIGAMNLFMSGSAFIYYGEEIGMVCGAMDDPSYRAPMVWNEAGDNGTAKPAPGCTLPESYEFGSVETQLNDEDSVFNYYRQAVAIRQAMPVISHGVITEEKALNVGTVSAQRKTWGEEECIILMNIDPKANDVDLSAYKDWKLATSLTVGDDQVYMDGDVMKMPAYGIAILVPAN